MPNKCFTVDSSLVCNRQGPQDEDVKYTNTDSLRKASSIMSKFLNFKEAAADRASSLALANNRHFARVLVRVGACGCDVGVGIRSNTGRSRLFGKSLAFVMNNGNLETGHCCRSMKASPNAMAQLRRRIFQDTRRKHAATVVMLEYWNRYSSEANWYIKWNGTSSD